MGFTFLYPNVLWGLLLVLIPIILHLFNFRRFKTVYFSNVSLLKEIKEESKKSKTLKNWLILLFRVLFITFLVLAFAFPIKGDIQVKEDQTIGIYIDNSFSMDTDGIEGNKLDNAKAYADQIINALPPSSKIHITTNDFKGDHQIAFNKIRAQEEVSKILPSSKSREIKEVLKRQSLFFNKEDNTNLYWISDFQQLNDSTFENLKNFKIQLGLLKSIEDANISIDSVWFKTPVRKRMGNEELDFKITNHGKEDFKDFNLKLLINDRINNLTLKNLPSGEIIQSITFQVPNDSIIKGTISIEDGFQSFDNELSFSYLIPEQQNILLIANKDSKTKRIIKRIFANDSTVNLHYSTPLDFNLKDLTDKDFIILGELNTIPQTLINELQKLAKNGKTIAVIPSQKIDAESYNKASLFWGGTKLEQLDTSNLAIGSISKKHAFFSGVFEEQKIKENIKEAFPNLYNSYGLTPSIDATTLIYKEDGTPFLVASNNFYLFGAGITSKNSNIAKKAIIVPLFYQMLFNSINNTPIQYFIEPVINIKTPPTNLKTVELSKKEFNTQLRLNNNSAQLPNDISVGPYVLKSKGKTIGAFSINHNRKESATINNQLNILNQLQERTEFSKIEISGNQNSNLSKIVDEAGSLWFNCLILAITFLMLEMIFIRIKN